MENFAITGVAGYVAPRHLKAIRDLGHNLVAAVDPHDSVGILDRYFSRVAFFSEFERFDRHIEKLRHGPEEGRVRFLSVCSPNHLHDAHVRLALRCGADAICEKPLVLNPWNIDALADLERETGRRIWTILQLRLHPDLVRVHKAFSKSGSRHQVCISYVTSRGPWYNYSWKGDVAKSGGIVTNIGIHLFDLALWLFGPVEAWQLHKSTPLKASGFLELERADVSWFLSIDSADLPFDPEPGVRTTHRSITVDGQEIEFSDGFTDLHTSSYERVLCGAGFGLEDARESIELVQRLRHAHPDLTGGPFHPMFNPGT